LVTAHRVWRPFARGGGGADVSGYRVLGEIGIVGGFQESAGGAVGSGRGRGFLGVGFHGCCHGRIQLFCVYKIRPQVFKVDFGVVKWIWFKIEIRSPVRTEQQAMSAPPTLDQ